MNLAAPVSLVMSASHQPTLILVVNISGELRITNLAFRHIHRNGMLRQRSRRDVRQVRADTPLSQ